MQIYAHTPVNARTKTHIRFDPVFAGEHPGAAAAVPVRATGPAAAGVALASSELRLGCRLGWCTWAWIAAGSASVPPSMLLLLTAALPIAAAPAAAAAVVAGTV